MRQAQIQRTTAETSISVSLTLEGSGKSQIDTGVGFLNHMLTLLSFHSRFDMNVKCAGDIDVDAHHSVEDIGIALGMALKSALGDKAGIKRYGSFLLPMDEALVLCALDLSGRCNLEYGLEIPSQKVGEFDTELVSEFMLGLCRQAEMTLHLTQLSGRNSHHIIEAAFKALGRSLRQAVALDEGLNGEQASSKGTLI